MGHCYTDLSSSKIEKLAFFKNFLMFEVLHLIIKKDYAASLIQHLQKENAIEIIEEEVDQIPEWQKEAVRTTLAETQRNPELLQPWEVIKQKYKH